MKKLLSVILVMLLALSVATPVTADEPSGDGYEIMGGGGAIGLTPATLVVPVRYGLQGDSVVGLKSGDVVAWDTNSSDGFTISACVVSNDVTYAGVLVSTIQSADSSAFRRNTRNWGKMAIKGYCLVKGEANMTAGELLVPSGVETSGGATPSMTTFDQLNLIQSINSMDVGVALSTAPSALGLTPVWLH